MKTLSAIKRVARPLTVIVLLPAAAALAQVESLNPNPTLPAGIGSAWDLGEFHHGNMRGAPMGGAEQNPAEIMLKELGGTNTGHRTGHAVIRGRAVRAALRVESARGIPPVRDGTVYFARRGSYEDALYAPNRGSYRPTAPRRVPTVRATNR